MLYQYNLNMKCLNSDSLSQGGRRVRDGWRLWLWSSEEHAQSEWVIGGQENTNVRQRWRDRKQKKNNRGWLEYLSTPTWRIAPLQHSCQDVTERQNTQTARCTTDETKWVWSQSQLSLSESFVALPRLACANRNVRQVKEWDGRRPKAEE